MKQNEHDPDESIDEVKNMLDCSIPFSPVVLPFEWSKNYPKNLH